MRFRLGFSLSVAFLLVVAASGVRGDTLTVSAAISLKEALTQIAADFESQTGDHVTLNFGASGQLAAQIAQEAPVDLFISAGIKEMNQLGPTVLYEHDVCGNELVLIVPADAAFIPQSFADLTDARIKRIAVGQPKTVPAGQYAQEVFDNLKITAALAPKLVFGENVRQVLDYIERGEVDAGVVYSTDAAASGAKVKVAARADWSMHEPIVYMAGVIAGSNHVDAARRFSNFLRADAAQKTLAAQGFVAHVPSTMPVRIIGAAAPEDPWPAQIARPAVEKPSLLSPDWTAPGRRATPIYGYSFVGDLPAVTLVDLTHNDSRGLGFNTYSGLTTISGGTLIITGKRTNTPPTTQPARPLTTAP